MMCFMASLFPDPECSQDGARPTATSLALCCLGWFPPFVVHHTDIRGDDGLFLRGCSVCVCLMFPRATPVNRFWQKYCKSGFFFFITSHRRLEDIESFLKTWVIGEFNHYKVHVRSAYHSSALPQSSRAAHFTQRQSCTFYGHLCHLASRLPALPLLLSVFQPHWTAVPGAPASPPSPQSSLSTLRFCSNTLPQ